MAVIPEGSSTLGRAGTPDGDRARLWTIVLDGLGGYDPGQVAIWNLDAVRLDSMLTCESAPGAVCFVSNDELIVGQWTGR